MKENKIDMILWLISAGYGGGGWASGAQAPPPPPHQKNVTRLYLGQNCIVSRIHWSVSPPPPPPEDFQIRHWPFCYLDQKLVITFRGFTPSSHAERTQLPTRSRGLIRITPVRSRQVLVFIWVQSQFEEGVDYYHITCVFVSRQGEC